MWQHGRLGRRLEYNEQEWDCYKPIWEKGVWNFFHLRDLKSFILSCGMTWWLSVKEFACHCRRHGFDPWIGKISLRRKWQPIPVFLPGKSYGQKSLAGHNPGGCKESNTTEHARTSQGSNLVFVLVNTQLSQHDIIQVILSLMLWTLFWSSYSVSLNFLSISISIPYNINFYSLK